MGANQKPLTQKRNENTIQSNIELVMAMDLEELAMLRAEVDEYRAGKDEDNAS